MRMPHYSYVADLTSLVRFHVSLALDFSIFGSGLVEAGDSPRSQKRDLGHPHSEILRIGTGPAQKQGRDAAGGVNQAGLYGPGSGSAVFLVHPGESPAGARRSVGTSSSGRLSVKNRMLSHGEYERPVTGNSADRGQSTASRRIGVTTGGRAEGLSNRRSRRAGRAWCRERRRERRAPAAGRTRRCLSPASMWRNTPQGRLCRGC